jgi:hypothetical protein
VLCTPHQSVKDSVVFKAAGSGGYAELLPHLKDDEIAFAACGMEMVSTLKARRHTWQTWVEGCHAPPARLAPQNGQQKHFFLTYAGPNVSAIKKGKLSLQKSGAFLQLGHLGRGTAARSRAHLCMDLRCPLVVLRSLPRRSHLQLVQRCRCGAVHHGPRGRQAGGDLRQALQAALERGDRVVKCGAGVATEGL